MKIDTKLIEDDLQMDALTPVERELVERLKQTPLKDISRGDTCALLDIIHRLAPPPAKSE